MNFSSRALLFMFLVMLLGCNQLTSEENGNVVYEHLCLGDKSYTEIKKNMFIVRVVEPNSKTNPDIWQGPICIVNSRTGRKCGFDLSLIKGFDFSNDDKSLEVAVFSGSSAVTYAIELDSCRLMKK